MPSTPCPQRPGSSSGRMKVNGKFLYKNGQKIWIKGVTYGTFRPDIEGNEYKTPNIVDSDFSLMAGHGINAIRTYTVPPIWLLDIAGKHGIHVMLGLPWEQHIDFLDDRGCMASIEKRVRAAARSCQCHPSIFCYAIGNEIPTSIVRWAGNRRVERFLKRLCNGVREEDPEGLITYVNYPSTEYLDLPFVDILTFNVYLEAKETYEKYLARLQNLAANRPLLMTEIGVDSLRHGEEKQAEMVDWQIRTSFTSGCAGTFVFSWTDEWHCEGHDIEDWHFGLVHKDRSPKPALQAAREAYYNLPIQSTDRPRISVIICSYNGSKTIRECLEGFQRVKYPNFEVIVVDDGSTDPTAAIAREFPVRLIQTENRGLSSARNTGMEAAGGEIIAYIDDDAIPDPHWLEYIAHGFRNKECAAVGGPNILPESALPLSECVANAPGNATHVLLTDQVAEHLPGCNIAIRKSALQAIGGFDEKFRIAGDDVDVCWRLQQAGWTLRYEAGAVVWHYRRNTIGAFWRQQKNYGRAEALLQQKWPQNYTVYGHARWGGHIYTGGHVIGLFKKPKIYQGTWGTALFQAMYHRESSFVQSLPARPEWYLANLGLGILSTAGLFWNPLLIFLPLFLLSVLCPLCPMFAEVSRTCFKSARLDKRLRWKLCMLTLLLHVLQPLARLWGQLSFCLNSQRSFRIGRHIPLRICRYLLWSENWRAPQEWLRKLEEMLRAHGMLSARGGDFDSWDFDIMGGLLGHARIRSLVEEHGAGKQLIRLKSSARGTAVAIILILLFALLSVAALLDNNRIVPVILGGISLIFALRSWLECSRALECVRAAALKMGFKETEPGLNSQ
jgi:GT2 family glycosyltransferase